MENPCGWKLIEKSGREILQMLESSNSWKYRPDGLTASNIRLKLDSLIKESCLKNPNIKKYCVNDGASNARAAVRLSGDLTQYLCCLHILQLAVTDVFYKSEVLSNDISEIIDKLKSVAQYVKKSPKAKGELVSACTDVGTKFIMPKQSNKTRWGSILNNFSSCLKLKEALNYLRSQDLDNWEDKIPNSIQMKIASGMVKVLERIDITTKKWEYDTKPTIQDVIPELWDLKSFLEQFASNPVNDKYVYFEFD